MNTLSKFRKNLIRINAGFLMTMGGILCIAD